MNQLRYYVLENRKPRKVDTLAEWQEYLEYDYRKTNCTIARHDFQAVTVLTVFNGEIPFNDQWGNPLLFETVVLRGTPAGLTAHGDIPPDRRPDFNLHQQYAHYDRALAGHHQICALIIEQL